MPRYKFIPIILSTAILSACGGGVTTERNVSTATLASIDTLSGTSVGAKHRQKLLKNIRLQALKETGLTLGAQSGLAYRAKEIDDYLASHRRTLDRVFDFNAIMLENNVLPPVLLEGRNTLNLASPEAVRIANRTYKISKQARFVTTPPNWRQYIWLDYHLPDVPDESVLPKTQAEQRIWQKYTHKGWQSGMEQAEVIFNDNLARLRKDYIGMIRYRKLLAQNMISPPFIAHTNLGVTGDSNQINIDDRTLRISALPGLNPDSRSWRASVGRERDLLQQFRNKEAQVKSTKLTMTDKAWQPVINKKTSK